MVDKTKPKGRQRRGRGCATGRAGFRRAVARCGARRRHHRRSLSHRTDRQASRLLPHTSRCDLSAPHRNLYPQARGRDRRATLHHRAGDAGGGSRKPGPARSSPSSTATARRGCGRSCFRGTARGTTTPGQPPAPPPRPASRNGSSSSGSGGRIRPATLCPATRPIRTFSKLPPFNDLVKLAFGEHGVIRDTSHPIYRELFGVPNQPAGNDDADL